jgi:anthranilate phosphoribosyltransferase
MRLAAQHVALQNCVKQLAAGKLPAAAEIRGAFRELMSGKANEALAGAFLVLLRLDLVTPEVGHAMRVHGVRRVRQQERNALTRCYARADRLGLRGGDARPLQALRAALPRH